MDTEKTNCKGVRTLIIELDNRLKKVHKKKFRHVSFHRYEKTFVHTTINGLGKIATLRKRR